MNKQLVECVPNFSEGRNMQVIKQITDVIEGVEGVKLLDVDPGKATNRTVVTFVGEPGPVIEAAFRAIKKAAEVIDMSKHTGEHPRAGATDVCPLIPIANISIQETVEYARKLGERVGRELEIPVYLYEYAATTEKRKNLATIRAGEYEGIPEKIKSPEWKPDFGPAKFNVRSGNTVIGARDLLIAYNINLNTKSVRRANSIAFDVREAGRVMRKGDPVTGEIVKDEHGQPKRIPGACKAVKAIGWFIEEYGIAQISMNLTDINVTPLHITFDEVCKSAEKRGLRVTGSELVGLIPLKSLLDAGKFFLQQQKCSTGVSEDELVLTAVRSLGLNELKPFEPRKRVIEYLLEDNANNMLINMTLSTFSNETASDSPAPGGGSVSAYVGALGISLGTMVANLSFNKPGWDDRWKEFSDWAERGQVLKDTLLKLVDEDTRAFNAIMTAFQLPKESETEKAARKLAVQKATLQAIEIPYKVMETALASMEIIKAMAETGNPNSVTDAGVGALCARSAVLGAFLNVKINCAGYADKAYAKEKLSAGQVIAEKARELENQILAIVELKIG